MNGDGTVDGGALRLAQSFAAQVRRWALARQASEAAAAAAAHAAQAVSLATSAGHTCVALDEAFRAPSPGGVRERLLASRVVTTPERLDPLPLVLDDAGRLYLHRYFDYERRLAARLVAAARAPFEAPGAAAAACLARLFDAAGPASADAADGAPGHRSTKATDGVPGDGSTKATNGVRAHAATAAPDGVPAHAASAAADGVPDGAADAAAGDASTGPAGSRVDRQRLAAALALGRRLTVISGGPGTGKTTTVVKLLACLLAQQPDCRIALAAPTGKAAARMLEAVRERSAALPPALRARLPDEARTIHRLLGVTAHGDGFRHDASNPLPIDVLVVDEASMLDLALATRLLEAVPPAARIVLLGDKDQLASVEAGAVFAEIGADATLEPAVRAALAPLCGTSAAALDTPGDVPPAAPPASPSPLSPLSPPTPLPPPLSPPSPLRNTTVWLTETHRFAPGSGLGRLAVAIHHGDADAAARLLESAADGTLQHLPGEPELLARVREGYAPFVDAVCTHPRDVARVTAAFAAFRTLCATRDGPRGVAALNAHAERMLRAALGLPGPGHSPWYPGRPVMVLRNDHLQKLFNGDVGLALPDAEGELQVHFPQPDGSFRALAPARLPEHETAFAITVHKSQGSEFDRVAVVLPDHPSRVLTRELLYTAVTRARAQAAVCGALALVRHAVGLPTRRHSGLLARLRELASTASP